MTKLIPLCASLLLAGCGGSSLPPASPPPPALSGAGPNGAGQAQGETERREDLRDDLVAIDAALADLNKRLEVARDAARAELRQQLAALQERDDALKAQVRAAGARADADADSARRQIHRAILSLKSDMQNIADRIRR